MNEDGNNIPAGIKAMKLEETKNYHQNLARRGVPLIFTCLMALYFICPLAKKEIIEEFSKSSRQATTETINNSYSSKVYNSDIATIDSLKKFSLPAGFLVAAAGLFHHRRGRKAEDEIKKLENDPAPVV